MHTDCVCKLLVSLLKKVVDAPAIFMRNLLRQVWNQKIAFGFVVLFVTPPPLSMQAYTQCETFCHILDSSRPVLQKARV